MKLQYLTVIFVVIIIPISLVLSQYIQNQIDTIKLQSLYTTNLNNATHDALKAFQINSVNNKYSSLSDSKIRDIEASINTFYNSLGTSMEEYIPLREKLSTFIPAILFTLYDGYYIYSTYENIYTTDDSGSVQIQDGNHNYQDGLRPYIYYSQEYEVNGNKIIVNYTLDNFITVYGRLKNEDGTTSYQTRSGYLIDPNDVEINGDTLTYKGVEIKKEVLTEHLLTIETVETEVEIEGETSIEEIDEVVEGDYPYIVYKNKKVYFDSGATNPEEQFFWYDNYKKTYLQTERAELQKYMTDNGIGFQSISAYKYYEEAKKFSEWVTQTSGLAEIKQLVNNNEEYVFDTTEEANDPILASSAFSEHRIEVIRNSIETNLTTAIANYNKQSGSNYEFVMPKIDSINWYNIANNVSIVSFMQGIPIGQKYYNNYSVITNTRNQEVINKQSIYILAWENGTHNLEYHQPGCKELIDKLNAGTVSIVGAYSDLSFFRQTVIVSDEEKHYFYPQTRTGYTTTGCYNCIVNASPEYDIDDIISGSVPNTETIRQVYFTALARERYDLYKSNNLNSEE